MQEVWVFANPITNVWTLELITRVSVVEEDPMFHPQFLIRKFVGSVELQLAFPI